MKTGECCIRYNGKCPVRRFCCISLSYGDDILLNGGSVPFYWVTRYCKGVRRCFSYYFDQPFVVGLEDELNMRNALDKKLIILPENGQKYLTL